MIKKMTPLYAANCARLHLECLPQDTLPQLGELFLLELYNTLFTLPGIHVYGFLGKKRVQGFIVGLEDSSNLLQTALSKNVLGFMYSLLRGIINRPQIIILIWEVIFYSSLRPQHTKSELLVICVDKNFRNKKIGTQLFQKMRTSFKSKGVTDFHVNTYVQKNAANAFYKNLGGIKSGSFKLFNKLWNSYLFAI